MAPPTTFRAAALPLIDRLRGLPTLFGVRLHTVAVAVRTWTGERPGIGTATTVILSMTGDQTIGHTKVRNVTQKDVIASGGAFQDQDLVVGPVTPPFPGSLQDNDAVSVFDPPAGGLPREVFFRITGPGYATAGEWFKKFSQRVDQPFRFMIWVRKTGETP